MLTKAIQRNPFMPIIKEEVPKYGFQYEIRQGKNVNDLILYGVHNGRDSTLRFPFPRMCRSFESTKNFKSKLVNFLRHYTKEIGFVSPDPSYNPVVDRPRHIFVQKLNLDQPKKELVPPKSILAQAATNTLSDVIAPPHIPTTYVGEKKKLDEPLSEHKVLAMFLVDIKDLSTLVEVAEGTAKFRGSKPAPLRLTGEKSVIVAPPLVPKAPKLPALHTVTKVDSVRGKRPTAQTTIMDRMKKHPAKVWSYNDFLDVMDNKANSVMATLSQLNAANKIQRIGRNQYKANR
jgi:hypothetical protein